MWDLRTLERLNEEAERRARENRQRERLAAEAERQAAKAAQETEE